MTARYGNPVLQIRLEPDLHAELRTAAGEREGGGRGGMSDFAREAIKDKLDREMLLTRLKSAGAGTKLLLALDTCLYRQHRWNFEHAFFDSIKYLIERGDISLLRPKLVDEEVQRQLSKSLKKKDANKVLEPFGLQSRFADEVVDLVEREMREAEAAYEQFHKTSGSVPVPMENADLRAVMEAYFSRQPPFGDGANSTMAKSEFPDAVLVSSLRSAATGGKTVVLVSGDKRVKKCSGGGLVVVENMAELLSMLRLSEEDFHEEKNIARAIIEYVTSPGGEDDVIDVIQDALVDRPGELDEWEHPDEEVSVYGAEVDDVRSARIISIENTDGVHEALVMIEFSATLDLEVSLVNVDQSPFDRETNSYLWLDTYTASFRHDLDEHCYLRLKFGSRDDRVAIAIEDVEFEESETAVFRSEAMAHAESDSPDYEPDDELDAHQVWLETHDFCGD